MSVILEMKKIQKMVCAFYLRITKIQQWQALNKTIPDRHFLQSSILSPFFFFNFYFIIFLCPSHARYRAAIGLVFKRQNFFFNQKE